MNRTDQIARLNDHKGVWDLIVIGGGATGLAIALDAATRGYQTVLLEAADFAESTSSKSTKLIHGGVRYLRGGEVSLVHEALHERGRLLKNAPNVVKPIPFIVPAYRWYDRIFYGTGLSLYDMLAGKLGIGKTGHFSLKQTLEETPNINPKGLRGGTYYWDAQFDDARLAIAMAKTAASRGGPVLNHVKVTGLIKENDTVRGVLARDDLGQSEFQLRAKAVINATGVFTDSVRKMDDAAAPEVITPSQGIHIVLDRKFIGSETGIMIPETDDGRVLFAIPWHNRVILGTTDTPGVSVELEPRPLKEEIDYLINHAARYLSEAPIHTDIKATFAGLRPLVSPPKNEKGKTSKISRKHSLFVSDSGLITMTGGKWTTCRSMAEAAIDRAIDLGKLEPARCQTYSMRLLDEAPGPALAESDPSLSEPLDEDLPYTYADIAAAVREEQAETLDDALSRRTRCRLLDEIASMRCAPKVAEFMAREKGKDQKWIDDQLIEFSSKVEPST
ncbi:MAG: glycerol-3-phosphate dehydrogenase/oxidase [Verrucomicrobiales bacterium]|nr:glycerol-3-phosphate dehydrogenase/oxidase [Verrucomicrobiales bacterium]